MAPLLTAPAPIGRLLQREPAQTTPTKTLPRAITKVLAARQATTTVVQGSEDSSSTQLSGGAIAGIVVGSIAGLLLLIWIIRSCSNLGNPRGWGATFGADPEPEKLSAAYRYPSETHGHRSRSRHSRHSHHSPRRTSIVEVDRPVYYGQRGRSPRPPPPAYYSREMDGRDLRRASGSRRHRHY
ncbi:hypothetical protein F4779DRAFT_305800 [Xylariaceae sp. FL0662B]|nr:hypothetical protein F4779DRAFT_305800 [Xylariaceae sp. FL0662B]